MLVLIPASYVPASWCTNTCVLISVCGVDTVAATIHAIHMSIGMWVPTANSIPQGGYAYGTAEALRMYHLMWYSSGCLVLSPEHYLCSTTPLVLRQHGYASHASRYLVWYPPDHL